MWASSCFGLFCYIYGVSSLTLRSYINYDSDDYNDNHYDFDVHIGHDHQHYYHWDYDHDCNPNDKHNDQGYHDNKHYRY